MKLIQLLQAIQEFQQQGNNWITSGQISHKFGITMDVASSALRKAYLRGYLMRELIRDGLRQGRPCYRYRLSEKGREALARIQPEPMGHRSLIALIISLLLALISMLQKPAQLCSSCGFRLNPEFNFCPRCGSKLSSWSSC